MPVGSKLKSQRNQQASRYELETTISGSRDRGGGRGRAHGQEFTQSSTIPPHLGQAASLSQLTYLLRPILHGRSESNLGLVQFATAWHSSPVLSIVYWP